MKRKISDYLTKEEIKEWRSPPRYRGAFDVILDWAMIGGSMYLVHFFKSWWSVLIALTLIGGRQLALAILMHEGSHRVLFKNRRVNDWVSHWLCGAPIWASFERYRPHHIAHHSYTGTEKDTDLNLVLPYPITSASFFRKCFRDLSGIAGLRRLVGKFLMDAERITYSASMGQKAIEDKSFGRSVGALVKNAGPTLLTNLLLFGLLLALGAPELYLLWFASWMTTFGLCMRIRSISEHVGVELSDNVFKNTRTTYATLLARVTCAPHHVNYHLEHHLLMTVPHYKLKKLHHFLLERGAYMESPIAQGYSELWSKAIKSRSQIA